MTPIRLSSLLPILAALLFLIPTAHADDLDDAIIQATTRYVLQETGVKDPAVIVEKIVDRYARVSVVSTSGATDPATAYLKKVGGRWKVVILGTDISAASLPEMGIPSTLGK